MTNEVQFLMNISNINIINTNARSHELWWEALWSHSQPTPELNRHLLACYLNLKNLATTILQYHRPSCLFRRETVKMEGARPYMLPTIMSGPHPHSTLQPSPPLRSYVPKLRSVCCYHIVKYIDLSALTNLLVEQCSLWLNKQNKTSLITGDLNFDWYATESNTAANIFFRNTIVFCFCFLQSPEQPGHLQFHLRWLTIYFPKPYHWTKFKRNRLIFFFLPFSISENDHCTCARAVAPQLWHMEIHYRWMPTCMQSFSAIAPVITE